MSENMVAIRCKSEMNRWMDSVMVVPQEQADDIEQSIKERMRGFERNGSCYGDVMREDCAGRWHRKPRPLRLRRGHGRTD